MSTEAPLPKNHPALAAWDAYKASPDFANSFNWADHEQYREGSMWAAFWQGYVAALASLDQESDQ